MPVIFLAAPPLPCCLCLGRGVSSVSSSLAGRCVYTFFFAGQMGVFLPVLSDFAAVFFRPRLSGDYASYEGRYWYLRYYAKLVVI